MRLIIGIDTSEHSVLQFLDSKFDFVEVEHFSDHSILLVVPGELTWQFILMLSLVVLAHEFVPVRVIHVCNSAHLAVLQVLLVLHASVQRRVVDGAGSPDGVVVVGSVVQQVLLNRSLHLDWQFVAVLADHFLTKSDGVWALVLKSEDNQVLSEDRWEDG